MEWNSVQKSSVRYMYARTDLRTKRVFREEFRSIGKRVRASQRNNEGVIIKSERLHIEAGERGAGAGVAYTKHVRLAKNEREHGSGDTLYTHVRPMAANRQSPVWVESGPRSERRSCRQKLTQRATDC